MPQEGLALSHWAAGSLPGVIPLRPSSGGRPAETRFCEGFHVEAAFTIGLKSRVVAQEAEVGSFFLQGPTGRASSLWAKRQS